MAMPLDYFDCLIVGAGPAGLTAAIYLARFRLRVIVIDDGHSRAALIPMTHNHAGFPGGIAGRDLLALMTKQAKRYGAHIERGLVGRLERHKGHFRAQLGAGRVDAITILLATGVRNHRPAISDQVHDAALSQGLLRYCPICDGYEVTDKQIGVIGTGDRGAKEALFLRSYSARITLIAPEGDHDLSSAFRQQLDAAGIVTRDGPTIDFAFDHNAVTVSTPASRDTVDTIYPALGSAVRSELAIALGARSSDEGCIVVDNHQQSSVPGLFAAGDVVLGLDQISHAMGEGGVAATAIRNHIADSRLLYR
jgi:thioredoxin reductase (NADPH)